MNIIEEAEKIVKKYKTRNPYEIADALGINVWHRHLGTLKGFYTCERKSRYIVLNNRMDKQTAKIVLAHELGHDVLHRHLAAGGIRETTMFLSNNRTEREANIFASHLMVSDDDIIDLYDYNPDIGYLCSELDVCPEIINYKLEHLSDIGYDVNFTRVNSGFLGS